ncbi:MAG: glycosyltransferase family 2 protein [Candidatus Yanofskybacteria bacterium]|nr:glycosyltransferase family 2 protein [Candidatus Yanofskybacteria bacterium]
MTKDYLHVGRANELKTPSDRRLYRLLEIFPGFLAWLTLALLIVFSKFMPIFTAIFIIAFDIYWLIKTVYLSLHMRASFNRMRSHMKRNWQKELEEASIVSPELQGLAWQDFYHLVILPMYKEPLTLVRESFLGLENANYPSDKLIVVLAIEERAGKEAREIANQIKEEFGGKFFKFLITSHPADIPGELAGKGSNETWAGREVKKQIIDPLQIPYERVIVSVFDIDTVVHRDFFACLTWHYITSAKPLQSSFQPIPIFTNNIWEAPAFARVFAFSTTFWQMIQQARPEQLVTFSSQSIGFKALVDVNFWQVNVVSEDSRIFWQCLLYYDGDWQTVPMYFPVYMDANVAPTFWETLKNQYKQIQRWHYGIENNPYFLFGFIKNKTIPWKTKWSLSFTMIEKAHSSSTNALVIFLLGWLPLMIGGTAFSSSILAYNLPRITSTIMNLAMVGLITSAAISIFLLPPRPIHYGRYRMVWMALQWVLFPINFIFFGTIPALDAQTRLMLGKYMGFWVTPKERTKTTQSDAILEIAPTAVSEADTALTEDQS